jgi:hypothetical protein
LAGNIHTGQYDDWNILLHNVVIVRHNAKGINTYELSLFGVMLAITLVRYHDMDRLKLGLYYDNILFGEYYDKIASNYKKKLPLIFGKWYLLKTILKVFSAYNFDIILDKETRSKFMAGDNSKFYNSFITVTLHNHKRLAEVQVKGLEEYGNYIGSTISQSPDKNIQEARNYISQKTDAVFQMIMKISVLLNPLDYDPVSFKEMAAEWIFFNSEQLKQLSHLYEIENTIEKALAEEVSFLYYLNLHNDYRFQVMQPMKYYSILVSNASKTDYMQDLLFPKQSLFAILRCNKEIRDRFSYLIENLVKYQKEVVETMSQFHEEISMEK